MEYLNKAAEDLAVLIRGRFPSEPMPSYPPLVGLDPLGERDEYAAFADVAWPDVPHESFRWAGYDISPVIGLMDIPRLWNYYLPGFMTASLLHEGGCDVIDGLIWRFREIAIPPVVSPADPWWGGDVLIANFSQEQIECVVRYLQFVKRYGDAQPNYYDWEPTDDSSLQDWIALGG